jgi:hypothetical protein
MKFFVIFILTWLMTQVNADEYEGYKLSWSPPNAYTNSEKLSVKLDLKSYKIYYGPTIEAVRENTVTIDPLLTSFYLSGLNKSVVRNSPIIYLAIAAISKSGSESDLSKIIFFLP